LKHNPDVFEAVRNRYFLSGWDHYISHGYYENRPGVPVEVHNMIKEIMEDDGPFPPENLRKRVHGDEDALSFSNIGKIINFNIYSSIKSIIRLSDQSNILDFGCGCGRVLRYFYKWYSDSLFYGVDIDQEAISWCQRELARIGKFVKNEESPPLPFCDEFFDFIYSISVFTHLPEDMQFVWLEELRRITKKGGYIIITTHGEELFNSYVPEVSRNQFIEKGFYYLIGEKTEGLPDFYHSSFHSKDYIYKNWSKLFEIDKIINKGIAGHQDLILCRRVS
jgi:SAM-dependent methyltransferase